MLCSRETADAPKALNTKRKKRNKAQGEIQANKSGRVGAEWAVSTGSDIRSNRGQSLGEKDIAQISLERNIASVLCFFSNSNHT